MTGASRAQPGDRPCIPYVGENRPGARARGSTTSSTLARAESLAKALRPGWLKHDSRHGVLRPVYDMNSSSSAAGTRELRWE